MADRFDVLMVGGGMASARLLEQLRAASFAGTIGVVGNEPRMGYNRILLPSFLAGDCDETALAGDDAAWSGDAGVTVCAGEQVER